MQSSNKETCVIIFIADPEDVVQHALIMQFCEYNRIANYDSIPVQMSVVKVKSPQSCCKCTSPIHTQAHAYMSDSTHEH